VRNDPGELGGEPKIRRRLSIPVGDGGVLWNSVESAVYLNRVEMVAVKLQKAAGRSVSWQERSSPIFEREALSSDKQIDHFTG
jgi:hypothetical protein